MSSPDYRNSPAPMKPERTTARAPRIYYLSNERIPSRYANTMQQMKMCNAFAANHIEVLFVRPYFPEVAKLGAQQIFSHYGVDNRFKIITLPTLLYLSKPPIDQSAERRRPLIPFIGGASVRLMAQLFLWQQWFYQAFTMPTVFYARSVNMAYVFMNYRRSAIMRQKPVRLFIEVHSFEQNPFRYFKKLVRYSDGIIVVSQAIADELINRFGCPAHKILVAPNGTDIEMTAQSESDKTEARKKIGIPGQTAHVVCYTGSHLPGKGVEVLVESARYLPADTQVLLVGGSAESIEKYRRYCQQEGLKNVILHGFVPPSQIRDYQWAADVLVLPNTDVALDSQFTSPLKLFNYMATRRPIVASNLPVFREILQDHNNALLVTMNNPQALAQGIMTVLKTPELAQKLAENAWHLARQYTWQNRAKKVLEFMQSSFPKPFMAN